MKQKPLGRTGFRWENCIRKHFLIFTGDNNGNRDWKEVVENRER